MPYPAIHTRRIAGPLVCTFVLAIAWTSDARPADSEAPFIRRRRIRAMRRSRHQEQRLSKLPHRHRQQLDA